MEPLLALWLLIQAPATPSTLTVGPDCYQLVPGTHRTWVGTGSVYVIQITNTAAAQITPPTVPDTLLALREDTGATKVDVVPPEPDTTQKDFWNGFVLAFGFGIPIAVIGWFRRMTNPGAE